MIKFVVWGGSKMRLLLGAVVIFTVGIVIFRPVFDAGFFTDDYIFAEAAARLPFPDYLSRYFDPRGLEAWYRPLQGMQWWIEYQFFGANPVGYHVVNVLIHLANGLLILALTTRFTAKLWVGVVAALVFITLPIISVGVYWPGVADPLMTLFFLMAFLFWSVYLMNGSRWHFAATFAAFIATILTKEMGVTVVAILFLMDRLFVRAPLSRIEIARRYAPFVIALVPYFFFEYIIQTRGVYVNLVAYRVSDKVIENLWEYLNWLAFPWDKQVQIGLSAIVRGAIALATLIAIRRNRALLLLTMGGIITLFPVLPFPFPLERYLYLPVIASVVLVALAFEFVRTRVRYPLWSQAGAPALLTLFLLWNGATVYEGAQNYVGFVRETRLQFRPLFQRHQDFEPDTLLYFIDPPFGTPNIAAMMFLRYGPNVSVYGTDRNRQVKLSAHQAAFIYYFDEQRNLMEQTIDKASNVSATTNLPVQFAEGITLEGFELTRARVPRGSPLVLILYWRGARTIERDYTVFVHLVDAQGRIVGGHDSEPRSGSAHMTGWRTGELLPDGIVIPIDQEVPLGDYEIQIGLYHAPTMQRLAIVDARGTAISDAVTIAPISVGE